MRCWVFSTDASAPCVPVHLRFQIWPQISLQSARAAQRSLAPPRSRFCLTTTAVSIPTLYTIAPTTRRRVDSFVHLVWDGSTVQTNLQLPICRFPTRCVLILHKLALRTTHFRLPSVLASKPNLSRAHSPRRRCVQSPPALAGRSLSSGIFRCWLQLCLDDLQASSQGHTTVRGAESNTDRV